MREVGHKGEIYCWVAPETLYASGSPEGCRIRSPQGQMALNLVIESPDPPIQYETAKAIIREAQNRWSR